MTSRIRIRQATDMHTSFSEKDAQIGPKTKTWYGIVYNIDLRKPWSFFLHTNAIQKDSTNLCQNTLMVTC